MMPAIFFASLNSSKNLTTWTKNKCQTQSYKLVNWKETNSALSEYLKFLLVWDGSQNHEQDILPKIGGSDPYPIFLLEIISISDSVEYVPQKTTL